MGRWLARGVSALISCWCVGAAAADPPPAAEAPSVSAATSPPAPWTDRWILDLNGAMPALETGDFRLNGEAHAGYNAEHWGIVARGGYLSYAFKSGDTGSTMDRTDASAEGWCVLDLSHAVRLELRGEGSYTGYDTTNDSAGTIELERARMLRGSGLAGLRILPSDRLAMSLSLGVGVQRERYDIVSLSASSIALPDVRDFSATEEAHARVQWNAIPYVLSARLRVDVRAFQLSHHVHDLTLGANGASFANGGSTSSAIDGVLRTSLDLDALAFFGFVPSAVAGVNVVSVSGGDGGIGVAPSFGIGVRRESM